MKKIILKKEKGITLIALVITIIVLLILAGVAISMLSGENGILKQAANAKEKYLTGKEKEETIIDGLARKINYFTGEDSTFDAITFDFSCDNWKSTYVDSIQGKLSIKAPGNKEVKWFYKVGDEGNFIELIDEVSVDNWSYSADYMTGEVKDSVLNIGYQISDNSPVNVKKYGFWETLNSKGYSVPTASPKNIASDSDSAPYDSRFLADVNIDFDYKSLGEDVKGIGIRIFSGYNFWLSAYLSDDFSNDSDYHSDWDFDGVFNIDLKDLKEFKGNKEMKNLPFQGVATWIYVFAYKDTNWTSGDLKGVRPIVSAPVITEKDESGEWTMRFPKPGEKIFYQVKLVDPEEVRYTYSDPDIIMVGAKLNLDNSHDHLSGNYFSSSGITLLGWYYDENFTNQAHTGDMLTGNVKLYGKYAGV